jgi:hypothetical protein
VRVYLAASPASLAAALGGGSLAPDLPAHAVTPALREWYTEGDLEELELAALLDAAEDSLRLLALEGARPPRRLVLAADVPDADARSAHPGDDLPDGTERSRVLLRSAVPLSAVVSAHVDEAEAEDDVRAACEALPDADAGDDDARFVVDGADGHDLLWYDASELADLSADLSAR